MNVLEASGLGKRYGSLDLAASAMQRATTSPRTPRP
jgi:hypothetical protein